VNIGKTLFAQLMDFLPWSTFARIVARYRGDARGAAAIASTLVACRSTPLRIRSSDSKCSETGILERFLLEFSAGVSPAGRSG
jgi:hypothetical protein